jgi:DNA-binding protein HU-beta
VIKLDIINEVVNKTGITKTKAELAVETVFESMKKALSKGDRIELRGFGVFNVRPRKTGIGRNPRTGAEVSIPPGKAVRFKPGKELQTLQKARTPRAAAAVNLCRPRITLLRRTRTTPRTAWRRCIRFRSGGSASAIGSTGYFSPSRC